MFNILKNTIRRVLLYKQRKNKGKNVTKLTVMMFLGILKI